MAAISTGTARAPGDPGYVHPQNGSMPGENGNFNAMTKSPIPPEFIAPHNGIPPTVPGCAACSGASCADAFDSISLRMRIRVPTNVSSFSFSFKFYTGEFPEPICQNHADFFVALLKTQWAPAPGSPQGPLPEDQNIALDAQGSYVSTDSVFFDVCFPPLGAPAGACPLSTQELVGTGMGGWGNKVNDGAATSWLVVDAPVVPGEAIDLRFMTWDAGDSMVDSLTLIDNFRWGFIDPDTGDH